MTLKNLNDYNYATKAHLISVCWKTYSKPLLQHNVKSKKENPHGGWIALRMYWITCCLLKMLDNCCRMSLHFSSWINEQVPLLPIKIKVWKG